MDPMMRKSSAVARVLSGDLTKKGVVLLKSESRKTKKGFWISEDLDEKVDIYLRLDNCASRSEFVENALRFYIGYLNTKNAGGFLPEALSAMLTGTLDNFAGRMARSCSSRVWISMCWGRSSPTTPISTKASTSVCGDAPFGI